MDADRFDALSRYVSTVGSRRGAFRGVLLGTLGVLGRANTQDAAAKNCRKIKDKKKRKKCLARAGTLPTPCVPNCTQRICGDDGCGGSCGSCGNAAVPDCCNGVCTNRQSDPAHCATCGTACAPGKACINGTCASACSPVCSGTTPICCPGGCADTTVDRNNCGVCGHRCAEFEYCVNGSCASLRGDCDAGGGSCGAGSQCGCVETKSGSYAACSYDRGSCENCVTHQDCRTLGYGATSICVQGTRCFSQGLTACTTPCEQELCARPGDSCISNAECCSNVCASSLCRRPRGQCAPSGGPCSQTKDCCLSECRNGSCAVVVAP